MSERATERDELTDVPADELLSWIAEDCGHREAEREILRRLRAASTDAPSEERGVDLDRSLTAIEADRKELELSEDFPPESEVPDDLFGIIIHAAWVLSFARSREWQNVRAEIVQLAKELRAPTDEAPERNAEKALEALYGMVEDSVTSDAGLHVATQARDVVLRRLRQPEAAPEGCTCSWTPAVHHGERWRYESEDCPVHAEPTREGEGHA